VQFLHLRDSAYAESSIPRDPEQRLECESILNTLLNDKKLRLCYPYIALSRSGHRILRLAA
jgi:hypothetical protein